MGGEKELSQSFLLKKVGHCLNCPLGLGKEAAARQWEKGRELRFRVAECKLPEGHCKHYLHNKQLTDLNLNQSREKVGAGDTDLGDIGIQAADKNLRVYKKPKGYMSRKTGEQES